MPRDVAEPFVQHIPRPATRVDYRECQEPLGNHVHGPEKAAEVDAHIDVAPIGRDNAGKRSCERLDHGHVTACLICPLPPRAANVLHDMATDPALGGRAPGLPGAVDVDKGEAGGLSPRIDCVFVRNGSLHLESEHNETRGLCNRTRSESPCRAMSELKKIANPHTGSGRKKQILRRWPGSG